jgi:hypothetical protein
MKQSIVLGLVLCFLGQSISSAEIGCAPREVEVKDKKIAVSGIKTWTAACRGKTFYCTQVPGASSAPRIKCTQETAASTN